MREAAKAEGEAWISSYSSFIRLPCIISDTHEISLKCGDTLPLTVEFHHVNLIDALDLSANSHFKSPPKY